MANNKKSLGVLLNENSMFDTAIRLAIRGLIVNTTTRMRLECRKVDRMRLAKELGIDRQRLSRICKALNIVALFEHR
ncbi:MAG: hypothetical protein GY847_28785 [Proteobacteria bacterium]|nr:hypothetical protein [Pseudomonadota bacterium]